MLSDVVVIRIVDDLLGTSRSVLHAFVSRLSAKGKPRCVKLIQWLRVHLSLGRIDRRFVVAVELEENLDVQRRQVDFLICSSRCFYSVKSMTSDTLPSFISLA